MIIDKTSSMLQSPFYHIRSDLSDLTRKLLMTTTGYDDIERDYDMKLMCQVEDNFPYLFDLVSREYIHPESLDWNYVSRYSKDVDFLRSFTRFLNWEMISLNPYATSLLYTKYFYKISWSELSSNPSAIKLLEMNAEKIDWHNLCSNPNAFRLLDTCPKDLINFRYIAGNPNALSLFNKHAPVTDINAWNVLATQPSSEAVELVIANMHEGINCYGVPSVNLEVHSEIILCLLASNPFAVSYMEQQINADAIDWYDLSRFWSNPNAIHLLEQRHTTHGDLNLEWLVKNPNPNTKRLVSPHISEWLLTNLSSYSTRWSLELIEPHLHELPPDSLVWEGLSRNKYACHIMDTHPNRINVSRYLGNIPACDHVFVYYYDEIRDYFYELHEELIAVMHHPLNAWNEKTNHSRLHDWGFDPFHSDEDIDTLP